MRLLSLLGLLLLFLLTSTVQADTPGSMKGFGANDPPTVTLLQPAWIHTDFGTYLMNYNFGTTKLVLNLTNLTTLPSAADILLLTTHPQYDRWWMVGINEPELNGYTPEQTAARITEQGNLILSVAPNARLSIMSLSQYRPLFRREYFWKVWDLLPDNIQRKVRAINLHFYSQAEMLPDNMTFSPQPIFNHLTLTRASMVEHGLGDLQLFVTEIGLAKTPYTLAHPNDVANYPNVIAAAAGGLADRWAIYPQLEWAGGAGYHGLMGSPYGTLTAQGQVFHDLQ